MNSPIRLIFQAPLALLITTLTSGLLLPPLAAAQEPVISGSPRWVNLFDGQSLNGWVQRNGKANYAIEKGVIVGRSAPNSGNSFLCTEQDYTDFILELEFKVHPSMNGGIQFRSRSVPDYNRGQVHGYQYEIDPSKRAWTGGIYDEGRRGWLHPLKDNEPARKAFKQNEWNKIRVEAIGPSLRTWINDVPAANLTDDMTPKGFVGLQVHGVGNIKETLDIRWRNIRILDLSQTKASKLFDGKSLDGWVTGQGKAVTRGWVAEEGVLFRKSGGGSIFTEKAFGDFIFDLEWKISEGGNSGIKYRMKKYGNNLLGPEYQVLDDDKHPDGQKREGRRKSAALYDLFKCNEAKQLKPVGEWNQARIIALGTHIQHWLNGILVLDYDTTSEAWKIEHSKSKFRGLPEFAQNPEGIFMLQDHGDLVWYRNIGIRSW